MLYPFRITCSIRFYTDETMFTTERVSRLVMAYDYDEAFQKFKDHYTNHDRNKVKFYNLEVEEPII